MQTVENDIIDYLNDLLKNRLTAINQYFLHARMLKHRGDVTLADHEYKLSIEAMRYADLLVESILSREGTPNLQELDRLNIGVTAEEMLSNDLILAEAAHSQINSMMHCVQAAGDHEISELLGKIRASLWEHAEYIRARTGKVNEHPASREERIPEEA